VYGEVVLPATDRGSRSGPRGARWSAPILLLIGSLALTGCISVTPAPGSPGPSGFPGPSVSATLNPSSSPAPVVSLEPRPSALPEPSPTSQPTRAAAPSVAPADPGAPSEEPRTAASTVAPVGSAPASVDPAASIGPSEAPASGAPLASGPLASGPLASGQLASPAPTPSPRPEVTAPVLTPGPPRELALAETEVYGFLPYWELARADTLDLSQLTTLAWFGVEANPRGVLIKEADDVPTPGWAGWNSDAWKQLQARAQEAGVRVVFTVQRFSWTEGQRRRTVRLLSDPAARMRLTAEVVSVVTEAGADGINLDFEPMPAEVSDEFTQLVREMRAAMNAVDPTLQLTFDVMPGIEGYDVASLVADDAADALFVMGYEYLTGSAAQTGSNAPLDKPEGQDLAGDVERILGLVPADRVILGLPWYGRAWSTTGTEPRSDTRSGARWPFSVTINYRDAILQAALTGRYYDTVEESAWTVYPSRVQDCQACRVTWRQLWYDDVDATGAKVRFAQEQELRGVGFWALGYQGSGDEMWSVLRLTLGGERDRRPPTGSAELDLSYANGERQGLPVVGARVGLQLTASDGQGSGPAFVRVSVDGTRDADGQLTTGTTFTSTDAIRFDVRTGGPVYDLTPPRAGRPTPSPEPSTAPSVEPSPPPSPSASTLPAGSSPAPSPQPGQSGPPAPSGIPSPSIDPFWTGSPSPTLEATPTPTPTPEPDVRAGRRVIRVQWRDVAGNWSDPVTVEVWFRPGTQPEGSAPPEPSVAPVSPPPFVPGASPAVDESVAPEASSAPEASPSAAPA